MLAITPLSGKSIEPPEYLKKSKKSFTFKSIKPKTLKPAGSSISTAELYKILHTKEEVEKCVQENNDNCDKEWIELESCDHFDKSQA